MFSYFFTFRSLTAAQQARNILYTAGIGSELLRAPKSVASQGCGFVLLIAAQDAVPAADLLRAWRARFLRILRVYENGQTEEAEL